MSQPQRTVIPLMGGHNSKADPSMVGVNALVKSQGVEYLVGDNQIIHKIPGRSTFGTVGAVARVQGCSLATYDDGTTFLLAVAGQKIWYADASNGFTGTFTAASVSSGDRKVSTAKATFAHFQNRWYIATGDDSGVVFEKDAVVVDHGMYKPSGHITLSTLAVGAEETYLAVQTTSHSEGVGQWFAVQNSEGTQEEDDFGSRPFTWTNLDAAGEDAQVQYGTTVTNSFSGRVVEIQYNVGDENQVWFGQQPGDNSDSADNQAQWECRLTISTAVDGGTTFTTHTDRIFTANPEGIQTLHIDFPDGTTTEDIRIKFHFSCQTNDGLGDLTLKIYSCRLSDGSSTTTQSSSASIFYAVTEFDANRGWESALSAPSQVVGGQSFGAVRVELPVSAKSNNATHFNIYRTSNQNTTLFKDEFGKVGQKKVGDTYFKDTFFEYGPSEAPGTRYEWLILDEFGEQALYEINSPPPPLEFIGNFKGAMFGLKNRTYYQSVGGRPNQWPALFTIERMPFKEHSPLRSAHQIGEVLWIGAEAGCILLDHPIETRSGSIRIPSPRRLEGAPGCTGAYASTPLTMNGESLIAWVSNHGVYISNMATFERITDDIDWEGTVTEGSLDNAVLFYREKKQQLVLHYDSTGDGNNDSYMLIHMGPKQRAESGLPLITVGHPGDFFCRTGGRIGGVYKEFTGHVSGAGIYLEEGNASSDSSNSYNGSGEIPVDIQTGRQYFPGQVDVGRAQLFVSTVSATVSLSCSYMTGRDGTTTDNQRDQLLILASGVTRSRWLDFNVSRQGDFMQWRFQHVGTTPFSLGPVAPMIDADDPQGIIE